MKTLKDLKDGDILYFVQGTEIKETIVKNFHTEVINEYGEHYCFETWIDNKLQFNWKFEIEEYKDETDTAYIYDGEKDYSYFCSFLNKKDAIKMLKKNIKKSIKVKQKEIENINKDIIRLEQLLLKY